MYTNATINQILDRKEHNVYSVKPKAKVIEAFGIMAHKTAGALLVFEDHNSIGIYSERDYAHRLVLEGIQEHDPLIKEGMTEHVIGIKLD